MKKKLVLLSMMISILCLFTACKKGDETKETINTSNKIKVAVSFNPLREFVTAVGKDKVEVVSIIPEGMEPHDFEPKIKDMKELNEAKLFVYNGVGMESWVSKTLEALDNKKLVVIEAGKGCNLIENKEAEEVKEHGKYDPHTWLSLQEAKTEARSIKDALVKMDSTNGAYYEKNYKEFEKALDGLYSEYNEKFKTLPNKNFVTGHAAFGYLCRDFGLTQQSVEGVFAEGEPTPAKMKELVEFCKTNKVKTVFLEELASPKVSETLAKEIGGKAEKIYTLETKEDGKGYIESMKENLDNIYNSIK